MGRVQQIIEFSQFSVVNAKFRRELWIYKIMTSVFDTQPPLIYVKISSVKEIRFLMASLIHLLQFNCRKSGEPDGSPGKEDHIIMSLGSWRDVSKSYSRSFVCQSSRGTDTTYTFQMIFFSQF